MASDSRQNGVIVRGNFYPGRLYRRIDQDEAEKLLCGQECEIIEVVPDSGEDGGERIDGATVMLRLRCEGVRFLVAVDKRLGIAKEVRE